jgi:hypothetical protein
MVKKMVALGMVCAVPFAVMAAPSAKSRSVSVAESRTNYSNNVDVATVEIELKSIKQELQVLTEAVYALRDSEALGEISKNAKKINERIEALNDLAICLGKQLASNNAGIAKLIEREEQFCGTTSSSSETSSHSDHHDHHGHGH